MFNIASIKADFLDLVGWRQNPDPNGVKLTGLTTSDSGIIMNGVSPLLTINNLASVCPDFGKFSYPVWNSSTAYVVGDVVSNSGNSFRCILAHTNQATTNATYWESWNKNKAFTQWLTQQMEDGAATFINQWANKKLANRTTESLLERQQLYTVTGSNNDTCGNPSDQMAGIEFRVSRSRSINTKLHRISLHLEQAQNLRVYLYKTGNQSYTTYIDLDYTTAGDVQWFDLNWDLKGDGAYYVCYSLNDLEGEAYDDGNERTAYSAGQQIPGGYHFSAMPFTADIINIGGVGADEIENTLIVGGSDVFVTSKLGYTTETQGLNFQLSVGCDLTDFVIEQRLKFAEAYSLFLAKQLLRELAYNPDARINRNEGNLRREEILYEIDGNPQGNKNGIGKQYEAALEAIQFDTVNVDEVCLTCKKNRGLSFKTWG